MPNTPNNQERGRLDGPDAGTGADDAPHFSPVCTYCAWWKPADGRSCAAYPAKNGIPLRIWASTTAGNAQNGYNHLLPVPGDHGKQFRLADGAKAPAWLARSRKLADANTSKSPQ